MWELVSNTSQEKKCVLFFNRNRSYWGIQARSLKVFCAKKKNLITV